MKQSNKERLYIALYARGGDSVMPQGEDKYHWALLVGPKHEHVHSKGKRFHVKETMTNIYGRTRSQWVFEERDIGMNPTAMILVRVVVSKVVSMERVRTVLQNVPIRDNQSGWNCVWWVKEALDVLRKDGTALSRASITDWVQVRGAAMAYVKKKEREHRFDGGAPPGMFDMDRVATYDLLKMDEIIA
ncbi:hypothetical protein VP1G_08498 [Cytospora mali]|uniref:Uncharacterized protein n=1 Tax=Cytospora mali TaxID=578113 RepID=A0A194VC02_CYTMA|nr:hypothetical protein VP1G_08498 [Valsa mali var. pyri (nom. inval.)]